MNDDGSRKRSRSDSSALAISKSCCYWLGFTAARRFLPFIKLACCLWILRLHQEILCRHDSVAWTRTKRNCGFSSARHYKIDQRSKTSNQSKDKVLPRRFSVTSIHSRQRPRLRECPKSKRPRKSSLLGSEVTKIVHLHLSIHESDKTQLILLDAMIYSEEVQQNLLARVLTAIDKFRKPYGLSNELEHRSMLSQAC